LYEYFLLVGSKTVAYNLTFAHLWVKFSTGKGASSRWFHSSV